MSRKRTVAIVDDDDEFDEDEDEEKRYCPTCYDKINLIEYLGPVILEKDESIPSDYHQWRQCYKCGRKYATSEVKRESQISDVVDVDDIDPGSADEIEIAVAAGFRRTGTTGRKTRLQIWREKQNQSRSRIKDPDALAAIKKGLTINNYEEYQVGID